MPNKNRKTKTSNCVICNTPFLPMYGTTGKYCSRQCGSIGTRKKEFKNCLECGVEFKLYPSDKKKFCCLKCYGRFLQKQPKKNYGTKTCLKCGKNFTQKRKELKGFYCSVDCSNKKVSAKRLPDIKCGECGKMFHPPNKRQKLCSQTCANAVKSRTKGENHPLWKPKVRMNCEICGQEKEVKPSLVSRFRACSNRCAAIIAQIQMPRVSSIEVTMQNLFQEAELEFQSQFVIGQYITDFAFENKKLVVECDGDYWHNLPNSKAKDRRKDGFLKHNGWKVLRLWEHEIKESPENCLKKVLRGLSKSQQQT